MQTPRPWAPPQTPTRSRHLRALGISPTKLAGEIARGDVVRLRRGVVIAASAVPDDPVDRHLLLAWAEQVADPALVAVGRTAALAWKIPFAGEEAAAEEPPLLATPKGGARRAGPTSSARIVSADLPAHHLVVGINGLRLTSLARTAIDVASGPLPELLVTLDAALRGQCEAIRGMSRRRDLANPTIRTAGRADLLEAARTVRSRDNDLARAIEFADPRRETPIESLSAGHMHLGGLPEPTPQAPIETIMGTLYPDFLWAGYRLIGEADGHGKYRAPADMVREKQREQVLRDLGFSIVRWTGREIRLAPAAVIDRIARALAAS